MSKIKRLVGDLGDALNLSEELHLAIIEKVQSQHDKYDGVVGQSCMLLFVEACDKAISQVAALAARVDALEKRLAKVCELACLNEAEIDASTAKPAPKYIEAERVKEMWCKSVEVFHEDIDAESGALVMTINESREDARGEAHNAFKRGQRDGVEKVARSGSIDIVAIR